MILRKIWGGNTLIPLYDNEDAVCGIICNNAAYYFQKNLQGDVIALTNHYGAVQVRYTYDAWGVPTVSYDITPAQIGNINPFRYRGYYYDPEIGMYYLQSRYYDPTTGRFINADALEFLGASGNVVSYNPFTYCENNPVNYKDPSGYLAILDDLTFLGVAIAATFVVAVATSVMSTPQFRQACYSFTSAVSGVLKWLWNKVTVLLQSAVTIVTKAVEKSIAKAKEVIKRKRYQDYYWIASKATFKRKNVSRTTYFPCMPIPKAAAAVYVRSGGDVFASSSASARRLAIMINGSPPVGPEKHGSTLGYFYHYHARKRVGAGKGGGHIFYLW